MKIDRSTYGYIDFHLTGMPADWEFGSKFQYYVPVGEGFLEVDRADFILHLEQCPTPSCEDREWELTWKQDGKECRSKVTLPLEAGALWVEDYVLVEVDPGVGHHPWGDVWYRVINSIDLPPSVLEYNLRRVEGSFFFEVDACRKSADAEWSPFCSEYGTLDPDEEIDSPLMDNGWLNVDNAVARMDIDDEIIRIAKENRSTR